ncbi:MAG: glycosyltransferase family 4 protein [Chloroflexota bacterium]
MRIAQLAPPLQSVPPHGYGGTERVVATLTDELVRRGHSVTLFASGDSRTRAELVPIVERALWRRDEPTNDIRSYMPSILEDIIGPRLDEFDIVHSHLDVYGFPLATMYPRVPMVTTMHGRMDVPEMWPTYARNRHLPFVSISDSQRAPLRDANWVGTVYHGIHLEEFTYTSDPDDYLVFVGRMSPEKGLDSAIQVARRAGRRLKIAARPPMEFGDTPEIRRDREYYTTRIAPLLDMPGIELLGELGGQARNDLLRNAAALLFPIRWPEPFGLVMIEALACGTPVLGLERGSVPEIITHGSTGFFCTNEDELVKAVGRIDEIDRGLCRQSVEVRFSPGMMAEGYERIYAALGEVNRWATAPDADNEGTILRWPRSSEAIARASDR